MNCARELEIAKGLAAAAGAVLLHLRSEAAGDVGRNPVSGETLTVAGLVADDLICSGLSDAFPDDSLCSRHSGRLAGWTGRVWLVDSLDGDQSFLGDGDEFTVSIGLALHGRPVLGVIYNPVKREMFAGTVVLGATLNGQPLVTPADLDRDKTIVTPQAEWQETSTLCQDRISLVPGASISYSMARVAAGRDAGLLSFQVSRGSSTCSGAALLEAARGHVTLLDGGEIFYRSDEMVQPCGIIAAAPARHAQLLDTVRKLRGADQLRDAA